MTTGNPKLKTGDDRGGQQPLSEEAYAMLAQANLLRIRGLWQEGVDKCMIAMQLSPGNAAAQSLLGDIYENMGQVDDAIRWYQLALDANPASIADRKKLDRLDAERRAARDRAPDSTVTGTIHVAQPVAAPATAALALRIATIVSGLALAIVVGYALSRSPRHLRATSASSASSVSTDPVLLTQPNVQFAQDASAPVRDTSEQNLLQSLQQTLATPSGAKVVDTQSDPRNGRVTVTLLAVQNGAIPLLRDTILRDAATAALALQRSTFTAGYSEWTVRYLIQQQAGEPSISFIGDSSRATLALAPSDLSTASTSQVEGLFSNEWWSAAVPAPAPAP